MTPRSMWKSLPWMSSCAAPELDLPGDLGLFGEAHPDLSAELDVELVGSSTRTFLPSSTSTTSGAPRSVFVRFERLQRERREGAVLSMKADAHVFGGAELLNAVGGRPPGAPRPRPRP